MEIKRLLSKKNSVQRLIKHNTAEEISGWFLVAQTIKVYLQVQNVDPLELFQMNFKQRPTFLIPVRNHSTATAAENRD